MSSMILTIAGIILILLVVVGVPVLVKKRYKRRLSIRSTVLGFAAYQILVFYLGNGLCGVLRSMIPLFATNAGVIVSYALITGISMAITYPIIYRVLYEYDTDHPGAIGVAYGAALSELVMTLLGPAYTQLNVSFHKMNGTLTQYITEMMSSYEGVQIAAVVEYYMNFPDYYGIFLGLAAVLLMLVHMTTALYIAEGDSDEVKRRTLFSSLGLMAFYAIYQLSQMLGTLVACIFGIISILLLGKTISKKFLSKELKSLCLEKIMMKLRINLKR